MGSIISSIVGGDASASASSSAPENSRVVSFHSSARWQLHFNEVKDSSQLVLNLAPSLPFFSPSIIYLFTSRFQVFLYRLIIFRIEIWIFFDPLYLSDFDY